MAARERHRNHPAGQIIVPYGVQAGLTINLTELRLFHVTERHDRSYQVSVYPLGIGREGRSGSIILRPEVVRAQRGILEIDGVRRAD
jgi:lipoprotein-anchoring transpeptidase ErfK/SrfK